MPEASTAAPSPVSDVHRLDASMASSVAWTGAVKWSLTLFTWVATIVVARLLSPEDYGLLGMAAILLGLLAILSEFGIGITIVTLRDLGRAQIAQLNGLALLLGVAAMALCLLFAVPAGRFFRAPALPLVIVVLSGTFIITALRVVPAALLQRDLQFRRLALIEGAQGVLQSGSTIGLAWGGAGYWALVFGPMIGQLAATSLTLAQRRCRFLLPRRHALGPALTFTRHQITGTLSWFWYTNADALIAGRVLGQAGLGVYTIAFTLARAIPEKVSALVVRVMPAFFAAVQQDRAALRRYLLKLTEYLALITFPALVGIAVIAEDIIQVIGPQWQPAVLPLRLLALFAAVEGVLQLVYRALTATRRTRFLMYDGLALAVIMPLGFLVGSRWGVNGIAATWLLLYPLTRWPALRAVGRETGVTLRAYLGAYVPAVAGCAVMAALLVVLRHFLPAWPLGVRLIVQIGAGAVVYTAFVVAVYPSRVRGLRRLLDQLRGRQAADPVQAVSSSSNSSM